MTQRQLDDNQVIPETLPYQPPSVYPPTSNNMLDPVTQYGYGSGINPGLPPPGNSKCFTSFA